MIKKSYTYEDGKWEHELDNSLDSQNTLVICFGSTNFNDIKDGFEDIVNNFKNSKIIGCSTSGEIHNDLLYTSSLCVMVMKFESSTLVLSTIRFDDVSESFDIGKRIATQLEKKDLKSIFVLSDGLNINGSQLTKGFSSSLPTNVVVTGGLAGDDANFSKTWVLVDNKPVSNHITAVGFYGDNFKVAYGSQGGWKKFGIDRMVTDAKNNILYKLDDHPALEIYKKYLGEKSSELPSSGLLYPLMIKEEGSNESKVRTILAVNEEDQSITFAGDIPNGSEVMFMKATFDELVEGASEAGNNLLNFDYDNEEAACIAISCVGRKLILGQKTEDELEAVYNIFGDNVEQIGYYSYGEISPLKDGKCDLHNQTMTLTLFWEI
jgi:hypothetical protein